MVQKSHPKPISKVLLRLFKFEWPNQGNKRVLSAYKSMDFLFLEFYIMKRYGQRVEEYFGVTRQSVSQWRSTNEIPEKRLLQFYKQEGSMDLVELFKSLYFDKN